MLIHRMKLAYRYCLVSDFYRSRVQILKISTADCKYKCCLDPLREGQVFTMENNTLQEIGIRNVLH